MREERVLFTTRSIPTLASSFSNVVDTGDHEPLWKKTTLSLATDGYAGGGSLRDHCKFACVSMAERKVDKQFMPTLAQFLKHPLVLVAFVPRDVSLFFAGAIAGAAAKTVTAPLDRIKILMQTHGIRAGQGSAQRAIGFIEAITVIAKEEGIKGYWKGNLPQVIRIIPYSAVQLFAYETYKVTYPLDVLRLRFAVEPGYRTMTEVALSMLRDE